MLNAEEPRSRTVAPPCSCAVTKRSGGVLDQCAMIPWVMHETAFRAARIYASVASLAEDASIPAILCALRA